MESDQNDLRDAEALALLRHYCKEKDAECRCLRREVSKLKDEIKSQKERRHLAAVKANKNRSAEARRASAKKAIAARWGRVDKSASSG